MQNTKFKLLCLMSGLVDKNTVEEDCEVRVIYTDFHHDSDILLSY